MPAAWARLTTPSGIEGAWRRALGTTASVLIGDGDELQVALEAADQVISRVDELASRFRPDSELSMVNADSRGCVVVSPEFAGLLSEALRFAKRTDGLLDPTIGAAMLAAGYDRDFAEVDRSSAGEAHLGIPAPGWWRVRLSGSTLQRPPGLILDLGATAKASAADRAATLAATAGAVPCLVSLGGDIATAGPVPEGGWTVRVGDDHQALAGQPGQNVALSARGLATSSKVVRRWVRQGRELHHLIDPRSGLPAQGRWRTVSVVASTCLEANALATAALVGGERGVALLERSGVAARLVTREGLAVHIGGWPAEGDELPHLTVSGAA